MFFDLPRNYQWNFQDPGSPTMEGIIDLHHNVLFILIVILGVVTYLLFAIMKDASIVWMFPNKIRINRQQQFLQFNGIIHGTILEIVWTIIPSLILFIVAIPSFALLYSMEEILAPQLTVKLIAHQWYWSYEYGNLGIEYDSYLVNERDLSKSEPRLLTVDHPLYLPVETNIRLIITSTDVIHSFAVPSLGLKVDAVPGRLNQLNVYINRTGLFYGQCSESCGVNHGYMPIQVVAMDLESFSPSSKN
jgi:cytochrome c oxidase subunit 2